MLINLSQGQEREEAKLWSGSLNVQRLMEEVGGDRRVTLQCLGNNCEVQATQQKQIGDAERNAIAQLFPIKTDYAQVFSILK